MTLFPLSVFVVLVYGGLGLTVIGASVLLALLARDWRDGSLW